MLESVDETIRIGEEAGLPSQITHHKVVGAPVWGSSVKTLAMVDAARARGVDVTIDGEMTGARPGRALRKEH